MVRIVRAMAWEYWRQNAWILLLSSAGLLSLLSLPWGEPVREVYNIALFLATAGTVGWLLTREGDVGTGRLGFPPHLYTRPVATCSLVAIRMGQITAITVVVYLCMALLVYATTDTVWPIAAPALWMALFVVWIHVAAWWFPVSKGLQVLGTGLATVLLLMWWSSRIDPAIWDMGTGRPVGQVAWTDWVLWALAMGLAYVMAALGVKGDRAGRSMDLRFLAERIEAWLPRVRQERFRSWHQAQTWREWRQRGLAWPIVMLVGVCTGLVLCTFVPTIRDHDTDLFFGALAGINCMGVLVVGCGIGKQDRHGVAMDLHKATRPVSESAILLVSLRSAITSLLAAWVVYVVGLLVTIAWLYVLGYHDSAARVLRVPLFVVHGTAFGGPFADLPWQLGLILTLWTGLGLSASLALTGRPWLTVAVVAGIFVVISSGRLLIDLGLLSEAVADVLIGLFWLACLAGSAVAFLAARRLRLIPRWLCLAAAAVYAAAARF